MAHHHHHQQESESESEAQENPKFLLDSLYCSEEHWEEVGEDNCRQELDQVDECYQNSNKRNSPALVLLEQDLYWDDEELARLLSKQEKNQLDAYLGTNPHLAAARKEAVEWMLKVNSHYSFSALAALLAVNYLDRFLSSFQFQNDKPWMTQLAAVACLSLAAKVEETQVPLLLDLQVEDSRYMFEAKTIKRMEILVLSTLGWKMNPVTPLSFLDYITRRLGLKDYLCWEFLKRCEAILLTLIADSRFVCYLPSAVATATMIHVVNSVEPRLGVEYQNQLLGILGISKDKVEECYKLILELVSGYECQHHVIGKESNKRKFGSAPGSPNGVMDVSFSFSASDSSNDSWSVAGSVSSSPEPLSKKTRGQDQLLLNHPNSDFLTIPR
ncbi:hypothetical protein L6164_015475 [Bauhinia variegata]|uniref:Uncharacterized protein n=1 Tax=Bauhinia variegata TaxID=167791 RepID=A0ACB9NKS4_BAUVA|nr:hypothetical protein L6164_015475 [Bauhinia variegata]